MELFCAGDVNMPRLLALACNRYPQATTTVVINGFYPEYRLLILVKTQIIYACSFHPQYLDNSCRMCSLHLDQHRVSVRLNFSTYGGTLSDPEYLCMVAPQFVLRKKVANLCVRLRASEAEQINALLQTVGLYCLLSGSFFWNISFRERWDPT